VIHDRDQVGDTRPKKGLNCEALWAEAHRDRPTARLLDDAISSPTLSRVLLLHREDLFPTFNVSPDERFSLTLSSPGFAYLTHSFKKTQVSLAKLWKKMLRNAPQLERIERAAGLTQAVSDSTSNVLRDRLVLGILNTIAGHDRLRNLVSRPYPIDFPALRQAVGDYSDINFQPLIDEFLALVEQVFKARKSKSAFSRAGLNIDVLKDATFSHPLHIQLMQLNVDHYRKIVCGQEINERSWRQYLIHLHDYGFLEHMGPLYTWCIGCPETGVLAAVSSSNILGRFHCPRCRRVAHGETTFSPVGWLETALNVRNGMLGACVGWQLKKHGLKFRANVPIAGTELDFVVDLGSVRVLIECKMPRTLKRDESLAPILSDAQTQLDEHVALSRQQGLLFTRAICVLNMPRQRIASIIRRYHSRPQPDHRKHKMSLISYEDLADWLRSAHT